MELDEAASLAGQRHAEDMVAIGYTAHWGSDGSVPESRYTEAGGEHLVHENVTCFFDGVKRALDAHPTFLPAELERTELQYMSEVPPHDGHRLNILIPTHNRLGIGIAKPVGVVELCMAQEFVDAYGEYDALPKVARAGQRLIVSGRIEAPASFGAVGVALGPLPAPLLASDLNSTSTYMMPTPYVTFLPAGFVTPRPVKLDGQRFSIEVALDRGAGRYAVSVWGRFPGSGKELGMLSLRTILVR